MELYLLRHGIAAEPGTAGYKRDRDRPLTPEGENELADIASAMKKLGLSFDIILSSPFVRARQTAEIVAEKLNLKKNLKFSEHLACGGNPKKLFEEIKKEYVSAQSLMLVGHEPYLSSLISVLVTGREDSSITMRKGGFCLLSTGALDYKKCACLEWLLTPKQMIAITQG